MSRQRDWGSILVGAALLGLLGISSAPAQQNSMSHGLLFIGGVVRDDDNQRLLGAVTLQLLTEGGMEVVPAVVSGTNGEFRFDGLSSGNYRLTARLGGYEAASVPALLGGSPLANVTVRMRRTESAQPGLPGSAVSAHLLAVPEKARDWYDKGFKIVTGPKPDYRKALSCFERATKEYPDYYEAYAEIGVAQQHLGDSAAAEKALRKSVEMSSSRYPDALFLLAEMLNDAGRFIDSQVFARQCVTEDESSWMCELELARAFAGLKHPVEAEAVANKASVLNPNNAKTFLILGNIHIQERKYEAVVQDFDAYLKLDPSGPMSDQVRASLAQARVALTKAHTANPTSH